MIGAGLIVIAVGLTIAMFATRERMLSFACTIWWAILSAHYYTLYTTAWVDIEYFIFFGSFGMAIFTVIAAFALREKRDTFADTEMDEESEDASVPFDESAEAEKNLKNMFEHEPVEGERTKDLKERKELRRTPDGRAKLRKNR